MAKEKKLILGRLTYFDVFIIFLLIVAVFIVLIKFISSPGALEENTIRVKLTFLATDLRPEVANNLKTSVSVFVSNNEAGKSLSIKTEPQKIEAITPGGELQTFDSNLKSEVTIIAEADVEKTNIGYFLSDLNLNIGNQYPLKVGAVSIQATLVSINEE